MSYDELVRVFIGIIWFPKVNAYIDSQKYKTREKCPWLRDKACIEYKCQKEYIYLYELDKKLVDVGQLTD